MNFKNSEKDEKDEKNKYNNPKLEKIIKDPVILKYISNSTDFKLMMLLATYHELSLTEFNKKSGLSKATLSRHLKKMLSDNIVVLSKEVLVRGDRKAQYFSLSGSLHSLFPKISEDDIRSLDKDHKNRMYKIIRATLNSSIDFCVESITAFRQFVNSLDDKKGGNLESFFNNPDFSVTFNLLSKEQYDKYVELMKEFNQNLMQTLVEIEKKRPDDDKSYLISNYLIPIKTIFDDEVAVLKNGQITEKDKNKSEQKDESGSESIYKKNIEIILDKHGIDPSERIKLKNDWIIELDLSDCELTEVPEDIKNLQSLETLHLENNSISELPEFVDSLPNLHFLDISKNEIALNQGRIKKLEDKLLIYW